MSIRMNGAGYNPAVRTARTPERTRTRNAAETAETAEEQSEQKQVDTFEPGADEASYDAEGKFSYTMDADAVQRLKADLEQTQSRFLTSVKDMLTKQGVKVAEGEGIWKQIAGGKYTVDEETRAAAQASISDGGYWSVEKTSERLVGYAKALVGGDPSKVEMMRDAFVKGYQEAEKLWGGKLPEISQKTYDATMKLFDDWANEGQDAESLRTA